MPPNLVRESKNVHAQKVSQNLDNNDVRKMT